MFLIDEFYLLSSSIVTWIKLIFSSLIYFACYQWKFNKCYTCLLGYNYVCHNSLSLGMEWSHIFNTLYNARCLHFPDPSSSLNIVLEQHLFLYQFKLHNYTVIEFCFTCNETFTELFYVQVTKLASPLLILFLYFQIQAFRICNIFF